MCDESVAHQLRQQIWDLEQRVQRLEIRASDLVVQPSVDDSDAPLEEDGLHDILEAWAAKIKVPPLRVPRYRECIMLMSQWLAIKGKSWCLAAIELADSIYLGWVFNDHRDKTDGKKKPAPAEEALIQKGMNW